MPSLDVPVIGQLLDTTEINRYWDCVPACIASGLQFLTGRPYDAGNIKDIIYRSDYVGGTAARDYTGYCTRQGVNLFSIAGQGRDLVNIVCSQIAKGRPVLLTEPDPYDNPQLYSHVVLACAYDDTWLWAMDPYIQQVVKKPLNDWANILEFNEVWPMAGGFRKMDAYIGPNANDTRVQLWQAFSNAVGKIPPREQTGIFHSWVDQLNGGVNRGSPFGNEFPWKLANGQVVPAQLFPGGVCIWHEDTQSTTWLDLKPQ